MIKTKLSYKDILVELPIIIHNSHLLTSFLHQMPSKVPQAELEFPASLADLKNSDQDTSIYPNLDSLDLSIDPFLEKNCDLLLESIETHYTELNNFQYHQRQLAREQTKVTAWKTKRAAENAARAAAKQPLLPEDDWVKLFKLPTEPSRLEGMLTAAQVNNYSRAIDGYTATITAKMFSVKGTLLPESGSAWGHGQGNGALVALGWHFRELCSITCAPEWSKVSIATSSWWSSGGIVWQGRRERPVSLKLGLLSSKIAFIASIHEGQKKRQLVGCDPVGIFFALPWPHKPTHFHVQVVCLLGRGKAVLWKLVSKWRDNSISRVHLCNNPTREENGFGKRLKSNHPVRIFQVFPRTWLIQQDTLETCTSLGVVTFPLPIFSWWMPNFRSHLTSWTSTSRVHIQIQIHFLLSTSISDTFFILFNLIFQVYWARRKSLWAKTFWTYLLPCATSPSSRTWYCTPLLLLHSTWAKRRKAILQYTSVLKLTLNSSDLIASRIFLLEHITVGFEEQTPDLPLSFVLVLTLHLTSNLFAVGYFLQNEFQLLIRLMLFRFISKPDRLLKSMLHISASITFKTDIAKWNDFAAWLEQGN